MVVFYGNREGAVGVGVVREDGGGDCKYALVAFEKDVEGRISNIDF